MARVEEVELDTLSPTTKRIIPAPFIENIDEPSAEDLTNSHIIRSGLNDARTKEYEFESFGEITHHPENPNSVPGGPNDAEEEIDLEQLLLEAKEQGREEGFLEGKNEAEKQSLEKFKEHRQILDVALREIKDCWHSYIEQSETVLLNLSFEIAETILDAPLPERIRHISSKSILEGLEQLSSEAPITIALNSIDLLRLRESGLKTHIETMFPNIAWDPQPAYKEGDWVAESPLQSVRSVARELLQHLRTRFGIFDLTLEKAAAPETDLAPPVSPEPAAPPVQPSSLPREAVRTPAPPTPPAKALEKDMDWVVSAISVPVAPPNPQTPPVPETEKPSLDLNISPEGPHL